MKGFAKETWKEGWREKVTSTQHLSYPTSNMLLNAISIDNVDKPSACLKFTIDFGAGFVNVTLTKVTSIVCIDNRKGLK